MLDTGYTAWLHFAFSGHFVEQLVYSDHGAGKKQPSLQNFKFDNPMCYDDKIFGEAMI
jgi:hypothetical protein